MTLKLHAFDADPRGFAKLTPRSYVDLGKILNAAAASETVFSYDLDPRWRDLLLFTYSPDASGLVRGLLSEADVDVELGQEGSYRVETPREEATGSASRPLKGSDGKPTKLQIEVVVAPGPPKSELVVKSELGGHDAVVRHSVERACRRGTTRGYPVADALFTIVISGGGGALPLADLHSAAQLAASRAIQSAGTVVLDPDTRKPNGETPALHDLETSIAAVFANLRSICHYPLADVGETDKKQMGAFLAYQTSMLYGHKLDERMRRQPAIPPPSLHPSLRTVTHDLLAYCQANGSFAAEMVSGLVEMWTDSWLNPVTPSAE